MDHLPQPRADRVWLGNDGPVTENFDHRFKVPLFLPENPELVYDGSRFREFANKLVLTGGQGTKLAPFLQAWLFFGLIKEVFQHVCGIEVDMRDFVSSAGDDQQYFVLTTKKLEMYICLWHAQEADAPADEKFARLEEIIDVLLLANQVLLDHFLDLPNAFTNETNLELPPTAGFPGMAATLLAIKVLGMTLCEAIPTVYCQFTPIVGADEEPFFLVDETGTQERLLRKMEFTSAYEPDPIINRLLERAGYCPYQIEMCDREYLSQGNLGLRWFMTFLDRRSIPGDHSSCTVERCVGYQVDEDSYETKHFWDRDCDCEFVSLSHGYAENLILNCVRRGGTPLIQVEWPFVRVFQMGVDEGPVPPYVAISHVWAEGMGNPSENALPRCQLSVLQHSAQKVCPGVNNVYFWMDTLCIPVGHDEERKKEIKKMASIYSEAERVLVMDRSLMEAYCNTYREEILIRIWRSPWASRLWTLQEGRLSKSLSFYFADKFYELGHIGVENSRNWARALYFQTDISSWLARYEAIKDPMCLRLIEMATELNNPVPEAVAALSTIRQASAGQPASNPSPTPSSLMSRLDTYNKSRIVRMSANNSFQSLGPFPPSHEYSREVTPTQYFSVMLSSLTQRSLTRAEDEAVCLATTLSSSPQDLIAAILRETSPAERMRVLLSSIGTLPLSILFLETERMSTGPDRRGSWIPRTLLCRGTRNIKGEVVCRTLEEGGGLIYQGPRMVGQRVFKIPFTTAGSGQFTIKLQSGGDNEFFIGIPPQPLPTGRDLTREEEKIYVIVPSQPPLVRDHIPQRVLILSVWPPSTSSRTSEEVSGDRVGETGVLETRYEFIAWLFQLVTPGEQVRTTGEPGQYHIWQPPGPKHFWNIGTESLDRIPFSSIEGSQELLIG